MLCRLCSAAEIPTWALAALIYGGWGWLTWHPAELPAPLWIAAMAWLLAWHGSLQHETIHGHPGGGKRVAWLIGAPPLALWLPYPIYRVTHLQHHNDARLTDPFEDPESYYASRRRWLLLPRFYRRLLLFNYTLAGRLLVGPAIVFVTFFWREARRLGDRSRRRAWAWHAVGAALVAGWLASAGVPPFAYLAAIYGATSLLLLRSFYEHRAAREPGRRTVIVEGIFPFGLLFLFNNLHAAHHARPKLAWYKLPAYYREHRATLLETNGSFLFRGYGELARRYLFRPNYLPVHPWA